MHISIGIDLYENEALTNSSVKTGGKVVKGMPVTDLQSFPLTEWDVLWIVDQAIPRSVVLHHYDWQATRSHRSAHCHQQLKFIRADHRGFAPVPRNNRLITALRPAARCLMSEQ